MEQLKSDSKRQAIHTLKGYSYQIWQSVLHWLNLQENQHLYLEGAEDIDLHFTGYVETTQIKEIKDSGQITLRSKDVIDAINHFWEHQANNPEVFVVFRFLTTAERGFEKSNPFNKKRGLDLWDECKKTGTDCALLKKFLIATKKLHQDLREFIKTADNDALREKLLSCIKWDTGNEKQDFIEKDVERKVIEYGDRIYDLPPFESQKIIPHLLNHAWETARKKENRWLTRIDFLNIFQSQTAVLIAKSKLRELERRANSFPSQVLNHYGVPQQQFEIEQSIESIFEPIFPIDLNLIAERRDFVEKLQKLLDKNRLAALTGSTGMGKSTLAYQIAASTEGNWRKIGLRDYSPMEINARLKIASAIIEAGTEQIDCILDDLNFDKGSTIYETSLIKLLSRIKQKNGRIIITSQHKLPFRVENLCNVPKDYLIAVPRLEEIEIRELALKHGCPQGKLLNSWSLIIATQTFGHPQLVHAQIRRLQYNDWQKPDITDIFSNEDIKNIQQEQRRQLTDILPDEARTLLYRLSIFAYRFNRRQALFIGEQNPEINNPGESLDLLTGPWIEPVDKTHFRLSPLVKNAASEIFSPKEIKRLHRAAATSYLSEKRIDSTDINSILMHGLAGENPFPLMVLVPNILGIAQEHKLSVFDSISWFGFVKTGDNESFFPGFPLANHMLRTLQFTVLAETDPEKALPVIRNWEREILEQDDTKSIPGTKDQMMFNFLSDVIVDFRIPVNVTQIAYWTLQLISLMKNTEKFYPEHPDAEEQFRNSIKPFDRLDIYVNFAVRRCHTKSDVIELLKVFEKTDDKIAQQEVFKILNEKIDLATALTNKIWLGEVEKKSPDWESCLQMLEWISEFAERHHIESLIASAYTDRSVIYEEYIKEPETALNLLTSGECVVGYPHPFLQNYRARLFIFKTQYQEALDLLRPVLEYYEPQEYPGRFLAYREATICAGHLGDWKNAAEFAYKGKKSIEQSDPDFPLDRKTRINSESLAATFQAEYAFALWKAGEKEAAVKEFVQIIDFLEELPKLEEDTRMQLLRMRIDYAVVWILNNQTTALENLNEPQPGYFSDYTLPKEIKDGSIKTPHFVWALLASLEYKLKMGAEIFNRLEKIRKDEQNPVFQAVSKSLRFRHAINKLDVENIISIFIENPNNCKAGPSQKGDLVENPEWDATTSLKSLIFTVLAISSSRNETWQVTVEKLIEVLSKHHLFGSEIRLWFEHIKEISVLDISTLCSLLKDSDEVYERRILAALRLSALPLLDPETRLYANLLLLLTNFIYIWKDDIEEAIEELIVGGWKHTVKTQRFALNMPNLTANDILASCENTQKTGIAKAAGVLLSSAKGVQMKVSDKTILMLQTLAGEKNDL